MHDVDGSAGGGQLVRTALALSARTGEAFRMTGIRGARSNPGLRPQHLAAVRAVAAVCDAEVDGADRGSETLTFRPGDLDGGEVAVDVGTAGSVTLVFDALLPLADALPRPLRATATGGTDVKWSPPFAFLQRVKLPLLARFGLDASASLARTGFYPTGGGEATLAVEPSTLSPVEIVERGDLQGVEIRSKASTDLADADVAERQADAAADRLDAAGLGPVESAVEYVESDSTGTAIVCRGTYDRTLAGGDRLGERGKPGEDVGREAADALVAFHRSGAAVDRHVADQLVPFVALAGGEVTIPELTEHVETCLDLLGTFGLSASVRDGDPPTLVGE